jgi:hypothetical protein
MNLSLTSIGGENTNGKETQKKFKETRGGGGGGGGGCEEGKRW